MVIPDPRSGSATLDFRFTVNYLCDCHLRKHQSRGGGGGPGLAHHHGGTPRVQVQLQQVPAAQILKCWFDSHRIQRFIEALYSDIKLQIGLYISCAKRLLFFICYGNPLKLLIKLHKLNPLKKYLKVGKFLVCLPKNLSYSCAPCCRKPVEIEMPVPHYGDILRKFPEAKLSIWQSSTW
jgi:hypothetical protein